MGILFCEMEVDCPKYWDELTPTEDPLVRDCTDCGRPVHFIDDQSQLDKAALHGRCVAFMNQLPGEMSSEVRKQLLKVQVHNQKLRATAMGRVTLGLPRRAIGDKLQALLIDFPDD